MSRHETASSAARQTRITRELTADEKAKVESYSERPNIRGIDEAIKKIKELFDVVVNESYIRRAVSQGRLDRHEMLSISRNVTFTRSSSLARARTRSAHEWIRTPTCNPLGLR
jgi:hypothetical protein